MKKTYLHPEIYAIGLDAEETLLVGSLELSDKEVDTNDDEFDQRTNKKNLWNRSGNSIWE